MVFFIIQHYAHSCSLCVEAQLGGQKKGKICCTSTFQKKRKKNAARKQPGRGVSNVLSLREEEREGREREIERERERERKREIRHRQRQKIQRNLRFASNDSYMTTRQRPKVTSV